MISGSCGTMSDIGCKKGRQRDFVYTLLFPGAGGGKVGLALIGSIASAYVYQLYTSP